MRIWERIEELRRDALLTDAQAAEISSAERGEPFSVSGEIRAFFYAGVLLIAAGVAATVQKYFDAAGPVALVAVLSAGVLGCFAYVLRRGAAWSRGAVAAPTAAFDYVLLLACLLLSSEIGYVESRWHPLGGEWQHHLAFLAAVFLGLAYRYDNRLALSLGLSSLAAWLGLELKGFGLLFRDVHRAYALGFGALCLGAGTLLRRLEVKAHFVDVYLNFAVHFLGAALLSGISDHRLGSFHAYALAALCGAGAFHAFRAKRFLYLACAALYGYAGLTMVVLTGRWYWFEGFYFLYFTVSSLALVVLLYGASRRIKEEA